MIMFSIYLHFVVVSDSCCDLHACDTNHEVFCFVVDLRTVIM